MTPQIPVPAPKKTPVWVWVLAGIAGAILLLVVAVVGAGVFVANKVLDVAQNPRELAKVIAAADPNLEMVDVDDAKKTIRVRDKKNGTVVTLTLSDLLQGKLSLVKEGKDGTESVEIGGKLNLPNWVPAFPGVEPRSLGSAHSDKEGEGGIFTFTTNVSAEKIRAFYQDGLGKRGLTVKAKAGEAKAWVMSNDDDGLHASVTVDDRGGERQVTVAYGEKKR